MSVTRPLDETHPVDERLPALKMATTGLQHVAAMYAGVVAPPLIVGAAIEFSATDLTSPARGRGSADTVSRRGTRGRVS